MICHDVYNILCINYLRDTNKVKEVCVCVYHTDTRRYRHIKKQCPAAR